MSRTRKRPYRGSNPTYAPKRGEAQESWSNYEEQAHDLLQADGVDTGKPIFLVEIDPISDRVVAALAAAVEPEQDPIVIEFDMAVDRSYRGTGLGRLLLNELMAFSKNLASDREVTVQADAVNPRMVEMLERRGFHYDGSRYRKYL